MSNTYILPAVVFAGVPGIGTVFSKRTAAPLSRSPSLEDAPVASIAAVRIPNAVHNNVRFLLIERLPYFFYRAGSLGSRISFTRLEKVLRRWLLSGRLRRRRQICERSACPAFQTPSNFQGNSAQTSANRGARMRICVSPAF